MKEVKNFHHLTQSNNNNNNYNIPSNPYGDKVPLSIALNCIMDYKFITINIINACFLALPIYSIYLQKIQHADTTITKDSELKLIKWHLLESWILVVSKLLYLIHAVITLNNYKIAYFAMQVIISLVSINKMFKYNNLKAQNYQIICESPMFSDRGVLLNHEGVNGYSSTSSSSNIITTNKKPLKQLDFFIDEEEEEEEDYNGYYDDTETSGAEGQVVDNKRFKLNAPVLATLLLLSPVHTEALPINIKATPLLSVGTSSPYYYHILSIVAFTLILLSKLLRLLNCRYNKGSTPIRITFTDFTLVFMVILSKAGDLFVYDSGGNTVLPFVLLGLNGLLVGQSVVSGLGIGVLEEEVV